MDVQKAMQRISLLSSIFGLWQIGIDANDENKPRYKIQTRRTIYTLFITICFFTVFAPLNVHVILTVVREKRYDFLKSLFQHIFAFGHLFGIIFAIFNNLWYRHTVQQILSELQQEIEALKVITPISPKTKANKYFITFLSFMILIVMGDAYEFLFLLKESAGYQISLILMEYVGSGYNMLMSLQFIIHALCIAAMLSALDEAINDILREALFSSFVIVQPKQRNSCNKKVLQRARILYHDLYETSEKLNRYCAAPTLWTMCFMIFITVYTTYNRIETVFKILQDDGQLTVYTVFDMVLWSSYGIIFLYVLILSAEEVTSKSRDLRKTLIKYLIRCEDLGLQKELKSFVSLIEYEKITFSPYGLFSLGKHMTLTIIGVGASYVVVFTQMPKASKIHIEN